jgi:hypothetical protein
MVKKAVLWEFEDLRVLSKKVKKEGF